MHVPSYDLNPIKSNSAYFHQVCGQSDELFVVNVSKIRWQEKWEFIEAWLAVNYAWAVP